jgi:hypothetical protein
VDAKPYSLPVAQYGKNQNVLTACRLAADDLDNAQHCDHVSRQAGFYKILCQLHINGARHTPLILLLVLGQALQVRAGKAGQLTHWL